MRVLAEGKKPVPPWVGVWRCQVCGLRRPMRRTERPMLGSRMPEPLPSARLSGPWPGFGVPGLTAVAQCFMNCVVGTDAWLKRTVGAPEEVLEWGRKRWGKAGELALHNIGWGARGLREARANG